MKSLPSTTKRHRITPAVVMCLAMALPATAQTSGSTDSSRPASSETRSTGSTASGQSDEYRSQQYGSQDQANPSYRSEGRAMASSSGHHKAKKADEIVGKAVHGDDGQEIGNISDLVIATDSGKITHAVIQSGGVLGIGGDRKAVSFDSLQPAAQEEGMAVSSNDWQNAQPFDEKNLQSLQGASMAAAEMEVSASSDASERETTATMSTGGSFILASQLDDLDIRGQDGSEIGEVDDVIVELDERRASLLVDVEDDVDGDDKSYVVGFNRVTVSREGDEHRLSTELNASDFRTAASTETSIDQPYVWVEDREAVAE